MLGAQLAPWRLWRSGLGQNSVARAASLDSAQTRSQGLRGLKKTVTACATPFCPSPLRHKHHGAKWVPNIHCSNHIGCCVVVAALPATHNQTIRHTYCSHVRGGGVDGDEVIEEDPSRWEGLIRLLTSRPSLRHLVSQVLVLIHKEAVYLQHREAS
jgi:hypothetical protein